MADLCSLCDETNVDAGAGDVCEDCLEWLMGLQHDLDAMEAIDPRLAELGREVEQRATALLHRLREADHESASDDRAARITECYPCQERRHGRPTDGMSPPRAPGVVQVWDFR